MVSADFEADAERIRAALRKNPSGVIPQALDACMRRYKVAIQLYGAGDTARASRRLKSCFRLLEIPESVASAPVVAPTPAELEARARGELEAALALEPDLARGLEVYRTCAACHMPEGNGLAGGSVPQIAGQHRSVIIKQLADIRAGNRDTVLMAPYASAESIGGAQAVADVAAYVASLEIDVQNGKGEGDDLELGERLYAENCARCHGKGGAGDPEIFAPRLQSQHYAYLVRQFEWIRSGKRRNANAEMVEQIHGFGERESRAVLDYVSRLEPPEALQAPAGWSNPDFAQ